MKNKFYEFTDSNGNLLYLDLQRIESISRLDENNIILHTHTGSLHQIFSSYEDVINILTLSNNFEGIASCD